MLHRPFPMLPLKPYPIKMPEVQIGRRLRRSHALVLGVTESQDRVEDET